MYDIIDGGNYYSDVEYFTIGKLIEVCAANPDKMVAFVGTDDSVGRLSSWRGAYDIPSIVPSHVSSTGLQVVNMISEQLAMTHHGYKGGEYRYSEHEEFYVSAYGAAQEYKVVDARVIGDRLILGTVLDKY